MQGIKEIDAQGLAALMEAQGEGIRLVDVRSPEEMAQGMIAGGEPLPLHLLPLQVDQFRNEHRTLVFYCRSGARSAQACHFLAQQGVPAALVNLRGGIIDWVRSGHPVVSPDRQAAYA
ncbi:rhodanese-like domain-containing protein [Thiohalobacter thiocyanaticus]|uniref:Rhodanese-like domain-containing protein n=1 Tax=Thiohalobacter thiocyanaticus TaxID=585455 RepID=A0A426QHD0_9GAMM|nr:rhodanese-like domain-containing protein [Thiohalobacter thiocyanaticus]RRQ21152.1 rhodanese-like domain-containing protein [Thiohalobacter thiocyanaticus]